MVYHRETIKEFNKNTGSKAELDQEVYVNVISKDSITIHFATGKCSTSHYSNSIDLRNGIQFDLINRGKILIHLGFNLNLTFQEYIEIKHNISNFNLVHTEISKDEFLN